MFVSEFTYKKLERGHITACVNKVEWTLYTPPIHKSLPEELSL